MSILKTVNNRTKWVEIVPSGTYTNGTVIDLTSFGWGGVGDFEELAFSFYVYSSGTARREKEMRLMVNTYNLAKDNGNVIEFGRVSSTSSTANSYVGISSLTPTGFTVLGASTTWPAGVLTAVYGKVKP